MRLFVHGMQSSGATAFTLFLAQRPDCLALVDIPNHATAPVVETDLDMVVKAVVTTAHPLETHLERFRPDKTILLLRDPRDNYHSLYRKNYRDGSGLMEDKFQIIERLFQTRDRFDAVIHYEDFVTLDAGVLDTVNALGWPVEIGYREYKRRHEELLRALWQHLPDMMSDMEIVFGNARGRAVSEAHRDKPRDPEIDARLEILCPALLAHYRARRG